MPVKQGTPGARPQNRQLAQSEATTKTAGSFLERCILKSGELPPKALADPGFLQLAAVPTAEGPTARPEIQQTYDVPHA